MISQILLQWFVAQDELEPALRIHINCGLQIQVGEIPHLFDQLRAALVGHREMDLPVHQQTRAHYEEAEAAGKAVFEKAGIGSQWYGWPGHFVGLATHDVLHPSGPIKPGQVVTVEPIVEFPDKQMHFRVEDTILITEGEPEILSAAIPKEMADVEKLVGSEVKEK